MSVAAAALNSYATPDPEQIGRFLLLKRLGQGAQGTVYLARDEQLGREVAIKMLGHRQQSDRLMQEARNVSNLNHSNIIPLYEIGIHEGSSYLVYEYFPGKPLKSIVQQGRPVAGPRVARIIQGILAGVSFAHNSGLIHRDLNPSNIMVSEQDLPRILDFGIAQVSGTETSEISGTPNYMAPEVLKNDNVTPLVDIFSIGLIMHEMLTGKQVFSAENSMAVMFQVANENILPPNRFNTQVDAELSQIVMRALQRDVSQRYQNAEEMSDAIAAYLASREDKEPESTEVSEKRNSTLEFLLRRMQRKQDFPAVSTHISDINQKSSQHGMSSANELANVILKDYALTTKLLRLVNSSYFGQFGGEITTISRAIVILGFEQVRAAALSIILFEHLKDEGMAHDLKKGAYSALMSGVIARQHAKNMKLRNDDDIETAFIASMFHQLGKLLAIYYFPEEYKDISQQLELQQQDENKVAKQILGLDYVALGQGIAKEWKLPAVISSCMEKMPNTPIKSPTTQTDFLRQISCFSNELCQLHEAGGDMQEAIAALAERYKESFHLDKDDILQLINDSRQEAKQFERILKLDKRDIDPFASLDAQQQGVDGYSLETSRLERTAGQHQGSELVLNSNQQSVLLQGISDITNAMLGDYNLNDVLTMILETIYRGLGFTHVLFCIRENKAGVLQGRFGFGKDVDQIIPGFRAPVDEPGIFNDAVKRMKETVITNTSNKKHHKDIPVWLTQQMTPTSIAVYPVVVNKRVIGVIYADSDGETPSFSKEGLGFLMTLSKQASLAIQQKS